MNISNIINKYRSNAAEMDSLRDLESPHRYGWSASSGWDTRQLEGNHFRWLRIATNGTACEGTWVPIAPKTAAARQWFHERREAIQAALPMLPVPSRISGAFLELADELQRPMWELKLIAGREYPSRTCIEGTGITWTRTMPRLWALQRELRNMGL